MIHVISEAVFNQVQKISQLPQVAQALEIAKRDVQRAMDLSLIHI